MSELVNCFMARFQYKLVYVKDFVLFETDTKYVGKIIKQGKKTCKVYSVAQVHIYRIRVKIRLFGFASK